MQILKIFFSLFLQSGFLFSIDEPIHRYLCAKSEKGRRYLEKVLEIEGKKTFTHLEFSNLTIVVIHSSLGPQSYMQPKSRQQLSLLTAFPAFF